MTEVFYGYDDVFSVLAIWRDGIFFAGRGYGLETGRRCTSLRKLCGPWVAIMATACATSWAVRTLLGAVGPRPENSVATLPGQTVLTRIPWARKSSAMQPLTPCTAHFDAQYIPPPADVVFP